MHLRSSLSNKGDAEKVLNEHVMSARAPREEKSCPVQASPILTYDDLSSTQQAVVKLNANPNEVQPIAWLNGAHLEMLRKSNSLSADLERRIGAYQQIKSQEDLLPPNS